VNFLFFYVFFVKIISGFRLPSGSDIDSLRELMEIEGQEDGDHLGMLFLKERFLVSFY